jgi:hypothetical protein
MKHALLLAFSIPPVALACAGTEQAPVVPAKTVGPPVVVDLGQAPAAPTATPKVAPSAEAKAGDTPEPEPKEAAEFGMIGLLSPGGDGGVPWGRDDSLGSDPSTAKGNMWGDSIGDAFGEGGLGLTGIGGSGGPGQGIGIGSLGVIGHGAGTGTGQGFGSGHGRLGGSRGKPPSVRIGATAVSGRLPPEVIQRIVRQNFGRFRLCYENGLRNKPQLQGKISVRFVIEPDGAVSSVANAGSDLPDAGVVSCVTRAFKNLSFPQPESGKVVVVYPLMFAPGSPAPSGTAPIKSSATVPTPAAPATAATKKP